MSMPIKSSEITIAGAMFKIKNVFLGPHKTFLMKLFQS